MNVGSSATFASSTNRFSSDDQWFSLCNLNGSNAVRKARQRIVAYNGTDQWLIYCGYCPNASNNVLEIGGCASDIEKACTRVDFYAVADAHTDNGTKIATIDITDLTLSSGKLTITDTTDSTNTTTGLLQTAGGAAIAKTATIGTAVKVTATSNQAVFNNTTLNFPTATNATTISAYDVSSITTVLSMQLSVQKVTNITDGTGKSSLTAADSRSMFVLTSSTVSWALTIPDPATALAGVWFEISVGSIATEKPITISCATMGTFSGIIMQPTSNVLAFTGKTSVSLNVGAANGITA